MIGARFGVVTGEGGEDYPISDQELLDALLTLVVGHEIGCGVTHLLVAAGLCVESQCARGLLTRRDAEMLACAFRIASEKADRLARACPVDPGSPPPRGTA